jgi:two-component system KDP operon response regulator KdpE
MSSVLVVDDERPVLETMEINLRARGYDVERASDGTEALTLAALRAPDVIVLDLGLPDIDGIEVIRQLREWSSVPIIVLSARTGEAQKVAALDAGANDYITKPFGIDELTARVRVALRTHIGDEMPLIETANFTLDLRARRARRGGQDVRLTATEWQIVSVLVRHPGRLVPHAEILEEVWGVTDPHSNYLRVFMVAIRRKLEPEPSHPRYFVTEPGAGIRFVPDGAIPR